MLTILSDQLKSNIKRRDCVSVDLAQPLLTAVITTQQHHNLVRVEFNHCQAEHKSKKVLLLMSSSQLAVKNTANSSLLLLCYL